MNRNELIAKIEEAEMVLLGLGEDFDLRNELMKDERYSSGCKILQSLNLHYLIPAWNSFCAKEIGISQGKEELLRLLELLKDKNYFVITVSTNPLLAEIPWKHERLVMPCGTWKYMQCQGDCTQLLPITKCDEEKINILFEHIFQGEKIDEQNALLGKCDCGKELCLNNVYAEKYNENGYLPKWSMYMKWLQGTVNRRLLILELGVGMKFPSIIRWPFEKVAFFNQKAYFCRVHEKLYQLTAELNGRGCGISANAIEWLRSL